MEKTTVYNRLYNDIFSDLYKDVYLINQENDINKQNSFKKQGWSHYIDGGKVAKITKKYHASYTFDYIDPIGINKKILTFSSYKGSAGLNLLDFINSVINADPSIFIKVDGFIVKDARKYLFEIIKIKISNSNIDDKFIKFIKKYFPNLEKFEFQNCTINKECNFNKIKIPIVFSNCIIENIRSFNDCEGDIKLSRCNIKKLSPTTLKIKNLDISCLSKSNYIDIKFLFFTCNFPNLINFSISPDPDINKNYSFEDSFRYLPYSAPNIEQLTIKGKVNSLNFLTQFKYLIVCNILSICDDMSLMYTSITDSNERKKINVRNKKEYEIYKILNPKQEDRYIFDELEKERILRLSHFFSLIDYTEEDLHILKNKNIIQFLLNKEIDDSINYYYECYFDKLYLKKQQNDFYCKFNCIDKYKINNNMLYSYSPYKNTKQIVNAKNFIFAPNGKPIIFKNKARLIRTIEEANIVIDNKDLSCFNLCENKQQEFINQLKNFDLDYNISIGTFIDIIDETCGIKITGDEFLNFGNDGKKIYYIFEQYRRAEKRLDDLVKKQKKFKKLLSELINNTYDSFDTAEKAYLYKHQYDYSIKSDKLYNPIFLNIYNYIIEDENQILISIDTKTNGLYSKYCNYTKLIYQQYYIFDSPYDIEIDSKHIKQLKF